MCMQFPKITRKLWAILWSVSKYSRATLDLGDWTLSSCIFCHCFLTFFLHFTSICEIVIVAMVSNQNWFCPSCLLLWVLCLERRKCWGGKQPYSNRGRNREVTSEGGLLGTGIYLCSCVGIG